MELLIKKLDERAVLPEYKTPGAAAMDLSAVLDAPVTVNPGETVKVPTGLAIALPDANWVALILARSGLGIKHGVAPANCVGVIDSDYRGELIVGLHNASGEPYTISPGERIAQLMIVPVVQAVLTQTDMLPETQRGDGGFGSTGKG